MVDYVQKRTKEKGLSMKMSKIRFGSIFVNLIVLLVLAFLLIPIIVIPILSIGTSIWLEFPPPGFTLKWYKTLFSSTEWFIPILNSLKIAVPVVFLSLLFGIPVA